MAHVLCVSWDHQLSVTRELLLSHYGYQVTSATGRSEAMQRCNAAADLLVLGHSIPQDEKLRIVECFRRFNDSPVLSMLRPGQVKLPNVEYGVEYMNPESFVQAVQKILRADDQDTRRSAANSGK